jgi:hypothetical protein
LTVQVEVQVEVEDEVHVHVHDHVRVTRQLEAAEEWAGPGVVHGVWRPERVRARIPP